MESQTKDIAKLSANSCRKADIQNVLNIENVFGPFSPFDGRLLFMSRFNMIPNWISVSGIDCAKANEWFLETCGGEIKDCFYSKRFKDRKGLYYDGICYFLWDDLLIYMNTTENDVKFHYRKTDSEAVDKLVCEFKKFKKRKTREKPEIKLITRGVHGLDTTELEISRPKFSIEDNYNDDFLPVHQTILKRLSKKNDKGIVLLHGKPGTGKTSYIRYLITKVKKDVIFLPPNIAVSITDPGLMDILISNSNSILVIEDAENIIIDRNRSGSSSVSALLNLADGLLSDCLNIQIICSFNTDLSKVDSALMRKGRLIAKYEFGELEVQKAQALSNKLNFKSVITSPMTLTAVYNQDECDFSAITSKRTVGFNVAV
jgi:hypothetical protein